MFKSISLAMSFLVGFLSLSQEILWVRLLGFLTQGAPNTMSIVLSCFLLGIAIGAIAGKKICNNAKFSISWVVYLWLFIAVLDFVIPEILPFVMRSSFYLPLFIALILLTAALKATIFPIAHHLFTSIDEKKLGQSLSYVYLWNILGSTLGPLLTGFVLLDLLSLFDVFRFVALVGLTFVMFMTISLVRSNCKAFCSAVLIFFVVIINFIFAERASFADFLNSSSSFPVIFVSENRQGIVHVVRDGRNGDIIYGGNAYDGRANISLVKNSNKIDRVFLLSALHPKAKKVLVIGSSGGAWVKVLSGNNNIEKIDVVEINPGYENYIKINKEISSILVDDRIFFHTDDGRRWLRKPENRGYYDLIVINTTFHWRSYSTNLLSKEMMVLVKSSLADGGIYAFNATGSKDAHFTASSVFNSAYRWSNFIYSSDIVFVKNPDEIAEAVLQQYYDWPYDSLNKEVLIEIFSSSRFISIAEELANSNRSLEVIRDDNMIVEYKYGL